MMSFWCYYKFISECRIRAASANCVNVSTRALFSPLKSPPPLVPSSTTSHCDSTKCRASSPTTLRSTSARSKSKRKRRMRSAYRRCGVLSRPNWTFSVLNGKQKFRDTILWGSTTRKNLESIKSSGSPRIATITSSAWKLPVRKQNGKEPSMSWVSLLAGSSKWGTSKTFSRPIVTTRV